jgi:hypothetical protein
VIDAIDRAVDQDRLNYIVLDEGVAFVSGEVGDVGFLPVMKLSTPNHVVALGQEQVGEVRAEETGGAGDENTHKGGVQSSDLCGVSNGSDNAES